MSIGKRIKQLRTKENLTQLELSKKLNVTDKAISKWETNIGEPSYELLIALSELFNVSLDYLMTGKELKGDMTLAEQIASKDDLELYTKNRNEVDLSFGYKNSLNGKSLLDYLFEYRSVKVLRVIFENLLKGTNELNKRHVYARSLGKWFDDFYILALEENWEDLLVDRGTRKALASINHISLIKKQRKPELYNRNLGVTESFFDKLIKSEKMSNDSWKIILPKGSRIYWNTGIPYILEKMILNKHPKTEELVDFIEENNEKVMKIYEDDKKENGSYYNYRLEKDGLVNRYGGRGIEYSYTRVTKEAVLNAVKVEDFKLAKRVNNLSGNLVSDYDMKMYEVNASTTMTKKDKIKESIYVGEIIDIAKLIATADYDLYLELIKEPATPYELALNYLENKKFKELYKFAEKYNIYSLKQAIIDGKTDLNEYIDEKSLEKHIEINKIYYLSYSQYRVPRPKDTEMNKTTILFKEIIEKHTDERFFTHALKTNPTGKDDALMALVANRGEEINLQKILLDAGAMIHSRWVEDDGWGYDVLRDEVDDVATQLLRNQIAILEKMKENK